VKLPALPFTVTDWAHVPRTEHPGETGMPHRSASVPGATPFIVD